MAVDAGLLFVDVGVAAAIFWPALLLIRDTGFYRHEKTRVRCSPPPWMFGIVWMIMYGLITAAAILHLHTAGSIDHHVDGWYQAIVALFIVNITLNHYWSVAFFGESRTLWVLFVLLVVLGTAIAEVVLYAIVEQWWSFGLYLVYPIWLLYALCLNFAWWRMEQGIKNKKADSNIEITGVNYATRR